MPLGENPPCLGADPSGPSLLHAFGVVTTAQPKTILAGTTIERLQVVIPEFKELAGDANFLSNVRNAELHSSSAALASLEIADWLPKFTRVAEVVCRHIGCDVEDVVGSAIVGQGRMLVGEEDRKILAEVRQRIAAAQRFLAGLTGDELAARKAAGTPPSFPSEAVTCPACDHSIRVRVEEVRATNPRLDEDGDFVHDVVSVAVALNCHVCGLTLKSTAEIRAAGLRQQYTRSEIETIHDRYWADYEPDYGND
jgi:hypothetical protein